MSQHPAPNVPIAEPEIRTQPVVDLDLVALGRAALAAVGWKEGDRLEIRGRALWLVCGCGCHAEVGLTGPMPAWLGDIATLIVWATNSLPALHAEIEALRNDLAAKRSDFDAACARLGELEAAQSEPAGYAVVTRNSEGGLHRSAQVWERLEQANTAEGIASGYADGTGCTTAVYELHEVTER